MKRLLGFGCILLVLGFACVARGGQTEDVEALVEQGLAMFKEKGRKLTLEAINDKKGPFIKGDLYVFAFSLNNELLAQPYDFSIRRINLNNFKDASGFAVFKRFKEVVENQGSGWVEYSWVKPGSDKPSRKKSFVKRVPEQDLYIGAGYYLE
ncbi:MAG TPA: cache domain-containing protein [Desulfomonilaceae bacterium]|nr:cache domain-containing protein [Desulfomonilaceae bacterium]